MLIVVIVMRAGRGVKQTKHQDTDEPRHHCVAQAIHTQKLHDDNDVERDDFAVISPNQSVNQTVSQSVRRFICSNLRE